jgi:hypothetical protein
VAACTAVAAIILVQWAKSPMDGIALFAGIIYLLGTWGGGMIGVLCSLIGLASPAKRAANPLAPLLVNVAIVVGFPLMIKLLHIGPSFKGGPAGF